MIRLGEDGVGEELVGGEVELKDKGLREEEKKENEFARRKNKNKNKKD